MIKPSTYVDSDLPRDEAAMIYKRFYAEEVIDEPDYPETGGIGLWPIVAAAVVLIALAAVASLIWPQPWFVGWLGGSR